MFKVSLVLIMLAGLGLRLYYLFQPIMHDEAVNYMYFAAKPLAEALSLYPYPNNHLLNTFFMFLSTRAFGGAEWSLRLPAFIAGVLVIPAAFFVTRRLFDVRAAVLSAVLVTCSCPLIAYSANARGYTLQTLIFLLLILVAIRVKMHGGRGLWALFLFLGALGFYAVPTMIYFLGAAALWILISALKRDTPVGPRKLVTGLAVSCSAAIGIAVLLYVPVIMRSGTGSLISNPWVTSLPAGEFLKGLPGYLVDVARFSGEGTPLALALVLGLGFIASFISFRRLSRHAANIAAIALLWCLALVIVQRVLPPPRVWLPLIPLCLGFAAAGLVRLCDLALEAIKGAARNVTLRTVTAAALVLLLLCASIVLVYDTPYQPREQVTFREAEQVAKWLDPRLSAGDLVFVEPNLRKPLEYHFMRREIPMDYLYRYPEDLGKKYGKVGLAFVVSAEGEGYPVSSSLASSNLVEDRSYFLRNVYELEYSMVSVIDDPVLRDTEPHR